MPVGAAPVFSEFAIAHTAFKISSPPSDGEVLESVIEDGTGFVEVTAIEE